MAAHRKRGTEVGLEAKLIDDLCAGRKPLLADLREQAARNLLAALAAGMELDDLLYEQALSAIGHEGIASLTGLVGFYCARAFVLRCYQVPVRT